MFKKVLVTEDLDSINYSVAHTLKERLQIPEIEQALYCDKAHLQTLQSIKEGNPFELLVTDLSFTKDHRAQKITNGQELIKEIRNIIPEIKVLVYSIENRSTVIKSLFTDLNINGYICKGRNGLREVEKAIPQIYKGTNYISQEMERSLKSGVFELGNYDVLLLERLAQGDSHEEISAQFKVNGITPSSVSTLEKRLNKLKSEFKAKNSTQLIAIVKDLGII